jgi:hypothetical protein
MKFAAFEEAVTKTLGYESLGKFADSTKLTTRSTITKWKNDDDIPKLMSAYIEMRILAEAPQHHNFRIELGDKVLYVTGDAKMFDDSDLIAHEIKNDYLSPSWDYGDIALCRPWKQGNHLEDGYWLFETEGNIKMFGALVTQYDGTYRLYRDSSRMDSFQFGKEHLHKMCPVAKAVHQIRRKG